jgi:hypothetical protein
MDEHNQFTYSYQSLSIDEQKDVRNIRNRYLKKDKIEEKKIKLQKLDKRVKHLPIVILSISIVIGTLIFGTGLAYILTFEKLEIGVPISIIGIVVIVLSFFIKKMVQRKLKYKYKDEIIALANEILENRIERRGIHHD